MQPPDLPAGVPAPDRDLAGDRAVANLYVDPSTDRVDVRRRLVQTNIDPIAGNRRVKGVATPHVSPHRRTRLAVHDDEIEHPIEVEIDERRPAGAVVADDSGRLRAFHERAVGLTDHQIARISFGEVRLCLDVSLGHEQVDEAVVVDVGELGVPGCRRQHVAAGERTLRGDATLQGDVAVRRLRRAVGQCLQLVVALARDEHLWITVAVEVLTGDAHPPDLQRLPAVGFRVLAWCRTGRDAPQLLLAVDVVVAVVRHAQIALSRPIPVAEQHRQRAITGGERDRRGVSIAAG